MMNDDGRVTLITGCMFSGKTTRMYGEISKMQYTLRKCIIIKFKSDDRSVSDGGGIEDIYTHDKNMKIQNDIEVIIVSRLSDADIGDAKCIGIDEGQFFPDLNKYCNKWADEGRYVVVAALDGTFMEMPFPEVALLGASCYDTIKVHPICMECKKNDAIFSIRTSQNQEIMLIGGLDKYKVVCRKCRNEMRSGDH